ncbi:MAG TPA: hypothetical protein PKO06_00150 [Candidatus Ozemobacteraceae bacterium]|nr:hypothetical protein [Candidatus Ozemobacteraceae bacterium]
MNILPLVQTWLLMIFLQFTPFTGQEGQQEHVFTLSGAPGVRFVIDVTSPKNALNQPVLAATGHFQGNPEAVGSLTAVILGFDRLRTLVNIEDADGIDQVPAGTKEQLKLFPGKDDRLAICHDGTITRVNAISEKGTDPREIEFQSDLVKALVVYDQTQGVRKIRLSVDGADSLEFVAQPVKVLSTKETMKIGTEADFKHAIIREYRGLISASLTLNQGRSFAMTPAKAEQIVIDNQKKYQEFVARIYPDVVTKMSPAPKSDDPLLKLPKIDFPRERLIVLLAHDGMYGDMLITNLEEKGRRLQIHCRYDKPSAGETMSAQPMGVGRYRAFVLKSPARKLNILVEKEQ